MVKVHNEIKWITIGIILVLSCNLGCSQSSGNTREILQRISKGSEAFSLNLFERLSEQFTLGKEGKYDFIISPFSIWSLLVLLAEGAQGNTLTEMKAVLHLNEELEFIRNGFKYIQQSLNVNTSTIQVSAIHALFYDKDKPLYPEYTNVVVRSYGLNQIPVDFRDVQNALRQINGYAKSATRGQIKEIVTPGDLTNSAMILASAIYFKGQWTMPFNRTLTNRELFHDEEGKAIGYVNMMTQSNYFSYSGNNNLSSYVLELPYGKENRLSMIILLPQNKVKLTTVVRALTRYGVARLLNSLKEVHELYGESEVEVYLPRFSYTSDLQMNALLNVMGIHDLFNSSAADLSRMTSANVFLSSLFHKAKITVNEKGTTASAVTTGNLVYKQQPQQFVINRPFAYLIVEKSTSSILFCGQVMDPVLKKNRL